MKNFLKILNKMLRKMNQFHIFKMTYAYTFIGMGLGWVTI
jgi:hypothetical protein